MRKFQWLLMAVAVLLFIVADVQAQFPGGGGGGRRFGRGGGGGWGGGGWGGGRRGGGNRDPGAMFDRFAKGKSVLKRDDMQGFMQGWFDRVAKAAGVTNGELTRDQWVQGSQQMMNQFRGGRGGFGGPARSAEDTAKDAESEFKKLDKNGDGKLNTDEMPKDLQDQKDKWDTNKDGLIDLSEYTAYYKSTHKSQGGGQSYGDIPIEIEPEDSKPVVYHAGTVPKDLQPTFQQYDTNGDGQISMYEWRKGGGSVEEFLAMDRNNDGLITIEEMLFYNANKKAGGGGPPGSISFSRTSGYNGGNAGDRRSGRRNRRGGFGGGN